MNRLPTMDYAADFLRGWPNEGALESSVYTIAEGEELSAGDLVVLNATGELVATTTATPFAGIIVRGNADDKSVAGPSGSNVAHGPRRAIVLWGAYIVRTSKIHADVLNADPMDAVIASAGVFAPVAAPGDPALGYVLEVHPSVGGAPASAVIVVK